jgi:hypothetical protein
MANNRANPQISLCSREFSLVLIFTPSKLFGFNQLSGAIHPVPAGERNEPVIIAYSGKVLLQTNDG